MGCISKSIIQEHQETEDNVQQQIDMRNLMDESRDIERVELGYFLRQSRSRLANARSGKNLFSIIEGQKSTNRSALKHMLSSREAISWQLEGVHKQCQHPDDSDEDIEGENKKSQALISMYDRKPNLALLVANNQENGSDLLQKR